MWSSNPWKWKHEKGKLCVSNCNAKPGEIIVKMIRAVSFTGGGLTIKKDDKSYALLINPHTTKYRTLERTVAQKFDIPRRSISLCMDRKGIDLITATDTETLERFISKKRNTIYIHNIVPPAKSQEVYRLSSTKISSESTIMSAPADIRTEATSCSSSFASNRTTSNVDSSECEVGKVLDENTARRFPSASSSHDFSERDSIDEESLPPEWRDHENQCVLYTEQLEVIAANDVLLPSTCVGSSAEKNDGIRNHAPVDYFNEKPDENTSSSFSPLARASSDLVSRTESIEPDESTPACKTPSTRIGPTPNSKGRIVSNIPSLKNQHSSTLQGIAIESSNTMFSSDPILPDSKPIGKEKAKSLAHRNLVTNEEHKTDLQQRIDVSKNEKSEARGAPCSNPTQAPSSLLEALVPLAQYIENKQDDYQRIMVQAVADHGNTQVLRELNRMSDEIVGLQCKIINLTIDANRESREEVSMLHQQQEKIATMLREQAAEFSRCRREILVGNDAQQEQLQLLEEAFSLRVQNIESLVSGSFESSQHLHDMLALVATGERIPCPRLILAIPAEIDLKTDTNRTLLRFLRGDQMRSWVQTKYHVYFYCEETFQLVNENDPMCLSVDKTSIVWMKRLVYLTVKVAAFSFLGMTIPLGAGGLDMEIDDSDFRELLREMSAPGRRTSIIRQDQLQELQGVEYDAFAREATKEEHRRHWRPKMMPSHCARQNRFHWKIRSSN